MNWWDALIAVIGGVVLTYAARNAGQRDVPIWCAVIRIRDWPASMRQRA
jgi:hypothetical protein